MFSAKDWKMAVDLDRKLQIPREVSTTNLRPDITIISRRTKQFGMIELNSPK